MFTYIFDARITDYMETHLPDLADKALILPLVRVRLVTS